MSRTLASEIRRVRRLECNMRAWVTSPTVPGFVCQVADISINGCRLLARNMSRLSPRVTMTIIDADLTAECEVVWQNRFSAGLRFISRSTQADVGADALRADAEAERSATARRRKRATVEI